VRAHARGPGRVGWADVEHWLWPLFSPRWAGWRTSRLGLPATPLLLLRDAPASPGAPPAPCVLARLLCALVAHTPVLHVFFGSFNSKRHRNSYHYCYCDVDKSITAAAAKHHASRRVGTRGTGPCAGGGDACGGRAGQVGAAQEEADDLARALPPAPRLLYGLSALVAPPPRYWPAGARLTGFWQPAPALLDPPGAGAPDPAPQAAPQPPTERACARDAARAETQLPGAPAAQRPRPPAGARAPGPAGSAAADRVGQPGCAPQWRQELAPVWPLAVNAAGAAAGAPQAPLDAYGVSGGQAPASSAEDLRPVCIDFGSMAALGLPGGAAAAVAAVRGALLRLRMRGVLLTGAAASPLLACCGHAWVAGRPLLPAQHRLVVTRAPRRPRGGSGHRTEGPCRLCAPSACLSRFT